MSFHILSLNGGGVRGLFQAEYLSELSKHLGSPSRERVDLIAGTSTGAIVALGIALGVPESKIADLFKNHAAKIFPAGRKRFGVHSVSWFAKGSRYRSEPLREALTEIFGDATLQDCSPCVVIPATTLDKFECRIFTTAPRCGIPRNPDNDLLAVDVALASAAAPLFFPATKMAKTNDPRAYVDGGLWANNPSLVAIRVAHQMMQVPFDQMRLISVGNGELPDGIPGVDFNVTRRMRMLEPVLDMMFATQMEAVDRYAAMLLQDEGWTGATMLRVNVDLARNIPLDDAAGAVNLLPARAITKARNEYAKVRALLRP